jgi:hypothetical protein
MGHIFERTTILRKAYLFILTGVITLVAIALGSGSEEALGIAIITPSESIFTLEDLAEINFKKSKTYDI